MLSVVIGALVIGGCSQSRPQPGPAYPAPVTQAEVLDIQALRDADQLTITNTTGRRFGEARLWANRWYSHPIDGFAPGQTLTLSLSDFVDEHGDTFRGGGFFAADKPDALAQMQLEENGTFYGLIVVSRGED